MRTEPALPLRTTQEGRTVVHCSCGEVLLQLEPGEGIYPQGTLLHVLADESTTKQGACPKCGAAYSIPVARWSSRR